MVSDRTAADLRYCLDLSHHPWTRPKVVASADAMHDAADRTIAMIEAADAAGLDSVWVSEDPDGWDAFGVLNAAARSTSSIRLGTGVTNPFLRHPNLLAMSVSTLDRLSQGRAFLGLGRGQPEWYAASLGMQTGSPLRTLEQTFRLLRQWWQPPYRASSGSGIKVNDWPRAIWPSQSRVPIYLAALGPKALDLAARMADGLLVADFASIPYIEELVPKMRDAVARDGRDPDQFHIYVRTAVTITNSPGPALHYRKTLMSLLAPLPGMSQQIIVPGYDIPAIIDKVRTAMRTAEVLERGGNFIDLRKAADFSAARSAIPDEVIDAVSFVGTTEQVRAKLDRLAALGVTHAFLSQPDTPDPDAFRETLTAIGAGTS